MTRAAIAFALVVFAAMAAASAAWAQTSLPTDKGLPLQVKVGVEFVDLGEFKENAGTFNATVDVRLRWQDLRLRRPAAEANNPPKVYLGAAAKAEAAKIWLPAAEIVNQRGQARYSTMGLRIYPDGTVELMRRTTGAFATGVDVGKLSVRPAEAAPCGRRTRRKRRQGRAAIRSERPRFQPHRRGQPVSTAGNLGSFRCKAAPLPGWNGVSHPQVVASLEVRRQPSVVVASIFIPLFASLLIPMLSIWLNRVEDGKFQIETFELVNIIIGGLFAVIALNFTIYSTYEVLGSGDNPVSRLFALNYIALGVGLLVNVLLVRFRVVEALFGRYVQEQLFLVLSWAIPVLALTAASAPSSPLRRCPVSGPPGRPKARLRLFCPCAGRILARRQQGFYRRGADAIGRAPNSRQSDPRLAVSAPRTIHLRARGKSHSIAPVNAQFPVGPNQHGDQRCKHARSRNHVDKGRRSPGARDLFPAADRRSLRGRGGCVREAEGHLAGRPHHRQLPREAQPRRSGSTTNSPNSAS